MPTTMFLLYFINQFIKEFSCKGKNPDSPYSKMTQFIAFINNEGYLCNFANIRGKSRLKPEPFNFKSPLTIKSYAERFQVKIEYNFW